MLHKVVMKKPPRIVKWAYGITTVPQRRGTTLPKTIASLKSAGFTAPRLFIDGVPSESGKGWENEFGLEVTTRYPKVKTFGNWLLGIIELYTRSPQADYYIMFQDDVITYPNLREYLELVSYPSKGYFNLFTYPENTELVPKRASGEKVSGWYLSNQAGRGAVSLMFNSITLQTLLCSRDIVSKPRDPFRATNNIDGSIVTALYKSNIREYVHYPSLVQHIGAESTLTSSSRFTLVNGVGSDCFWGEGFDALGLIPRKDQVE